MKRFLSFTGAIALLTLSFASFLQAALIYEEDFSTVASGWNTRSYAYGETLFAPGSPTGAPFPTRSLLLSHHSGNTTTMVSSSPLFAGVEGNGQFELSFSVRLNQNNFNAAITLWDSAKTNQAPLNIKIRNSGIIEAAYYNSGTGANQFVSLGSYSADTTYTFLLSFNPAAQLYSISLNGVVVAEDLAFARTNQGAITFEKLDQVMLQNYGRAAGSGNVDFYFDDLRVTSVPEPSAVGGAVLLALTFLARYRRRA